MAKGHRAILRGSGYSAGGKNNAQPGCEKKLRVIHETARDFQLAAQRTSGELLEDWPSYSYGSAIPSRHSPIAGRLRS
jgi:hypothetical protein